MKDLKSKTQQRTSYALVVDDNDADRTVAKRLLTHNPHIQDRLLILEASSVGEALRILSEAPIEVVLLDMHLGPDPDRASDNGIESIPAMLKRQPFAQIVVITGSEKSKDAVRAMKLGAFDFVSKATSKEEKQKKVAAAIAKAKDRFEATLKDRFKYSPSNAPSKLGGSSPDWMRAISDIVIYSPSAFPILITGETGTGKTELARLVHEEREKKGSSRAFVAVNMAAITPDIAERELFGNDEGAFTGASRDKPGYFELANHGTIFLDEIGDASLDLQTKILKVIEEGTFYRVGGETPVHVKVKIVCATHRDLEKMVEEGKFREDLLMRLSILPVHIAPLSSRKQDTPEIIEAMLPRICEHAALNEEIHFEELPKDFVEYLVQTPFRGNARGIWQRLARLIVKAPVNSEGAKVFSNWREFLGYPERSSRAQLSPAPPRNIQDVLDSPIIFSETDFPGVNELATKLQDRIYTEALRKYRTINKVARVLKVSPSTAYGNLKRIGLVTPTRSPRRGRASSPQKS